MLKFISPLSIFDWLDFLGLAMVTIGCLGELFIRFEFVKSLLKFPYNPTNFPHLSKKEHLIEAVFASLIFIGLAFEIIALPKHFSEIVTMQQKVEKHRTANDELEKQIVQARIDADPLNKPIIALYAFVKFNVGVKGWNPGKHPELVDTVVKAPDANGTMGELTFFNSTNLNVVSLSFVSKDLFVRYDDFPSINSGFIQFQFKEADTHQHPKKVEITVPISMIDANAGIITNFDSVSLKLFIKPMDAWMYSASATLVINLTPKVFPLKAVSFLEYPVIFK